MQGDIDVIVVGAGLAGLVAARDIALKGYKVVIFESNDRIGGRAWSKHFPGTDVRVDIGGEFYDMNVHKQTVEEVKRQKVRISKLAYEGSTAWTFKFPCNFIVTPAFCPDMYKEEYNRVTKQMNQDITRVNFREGLDQGAVSFLDIPWTEYVIKRCQATEFVQEYLLSEAFTMFQADPASLSALSVLHCLAGFGSPEEILNTRVREGEPFKKREYARVDEGMSHLTERIANEFLSLGGEIRLRTAVGSIICDPVPAEGSKRYCAICARYTFPFCSFHGPRVSVVDALGTQIRARACVVAVPLACLPAFKFAPELSTTLQHASETCNISGDSQKVWIEAEKVSSDVNQVQSWPSLVHSYVKESHECRSGEGTEGRLSGLGEESSIDDDSMDHEEEDRADYKQGEGDSAASGTTTTCSEDHADSPHKSTSTAGRDRGSRVSDKVMDTSTHHLDFKPYHHDYDALEYSQTVIEDLESAGEKAEAGKGRQSRRYSAFVTADAYADGRRSSVMMSSGSDAVTPMREKAGAPSLGVTKVEEDAKVMRQRKRRESIQAHKAMLDRKDMAAGLRGNGSESKVEGCSGGLDESSASVASSAAWVTILASIGLKENLGEHGEKTPGLVPLHHPSAVCRKFLSHDWKSDKNLRGGMFALRAGTAHLHAEACLHAVKPWPHTENLTITGGDVSLWWTGWIEGAVATGKRSAQRILHFLDPPVPVANHIERRNSDMELVKEIEKQRLQEKAREKEREKIRREAEAKERKAAMFKY